MVLALGCSANVLRIDSVLRFRTAAESSGCTRLYIPAEPQHQFDSVNATSFTPGKLFHSFRGFSSTFWACIKWQGAS